RRPSCSDGGAPNRKAKTIQKMRNPNTIAGASERASGESRPPTAYTNTQPMRTLAKSARFPAIAKWRITQPGVLFDAWDWIRRWCVVGLRRPSNRYDPDDRGQDDCDDCYSP